MKLFRKNAVLVAAAFGALVAFTPAQAYVMAGAVVNMTNFTISSGGSILNYAADFTQISFTSSAQQQASLTGFATVDTGTNSGTGIDYVPICLGAGFCPGNNTFPKPLIAPGGNYSVADQLETGAPISNVPASGGGVLATPAQIANAAYSALISGSGVGGAQSTNELSSNFIFQLAQASPGLRFQFDVDAFLQVAVSADEIAPGKAQATYQIEFTLTNLTGGATPGIPFLTVSPDIFGNGVKTLPLNAPNLGQVQLVLDTGGPLAGLFFNTGALNNTDQYQLGARIQVNTVVERQQAVPEPAMLSLVGLGLLAAGFGARRRVKQV